MTLLIMETNFQYVSINQTVHGMHIDGADEKIARKIKVEAVKEPTKEFATCS